MDECNGCPRLEPQIVVAAAAAQATAYVVDENLCNGADPSNSIAEEQVKVVQQHRIAADEGREAWKGLIPRLIWEGDSAFDAWIITSSVQVAQVLLTLPSSFAQLGLASGIVLQILYGFMGCWSCYVTTALYADYRHLRESQNVDFLNHTIQWFEVLQGLLGPPWMFLGLFFNVMYMSFVAVIQIIATGSIAYYINDHHSKRTWTMIFGALFVMSTLIPTAQNYRLWCFMGILITTYVAWYLTIVAVTHGQVVDAMHKGPTKLEDYFNGASNILYTFGCTGFNLEIMHVMWKPRKYKLVYLYTILYILSLTIPSASAMYWAFGDKLLNNYNALALLPKTKARKITAIAMLLHQVIEASFACLPIYIVWEKALGIHHSPHFLKKVIARVPIVLLFWFIALMFPFFGPIDSVVGSLLTAGAVYILPCFAHLAYYWSIKTRQIAIEKPFKWMRSWRLILCIDVFVIAWVTVIGVGFGGWASMKTFLQEVHEFGLFENCFGCSSKSHE